MISSPTDTITSKPGVGAVRGAGLAGGGGGGGGRGSSQSGSPELDFASSALPTTESPSTAPLPTEASYASYEYCTHTGPGFAGGHLHQGR